MGKTELSTEFASPARSDPDEIKQQTRRITRSLLFKRLSIFINDPVLVLNQNRQIVYVNPTAGKVIDAFLHEDPTGLRPGEVLLCEHAKAATCGCGTSSFCRYCGAVKTILSSLRGVEDVDECLITQEGGDTLAFMCYAYPVQIGRDVFSLFVLKDISKERRIQILERIFFHDVKNLLTVFNGWTKMLNGANNIDQSHEISQMLVQLGDELVDEVTAQEELIGAETNQLTTNLSSVDSLNLLSDLRKIYTKHEMAEGREIVIDSEAQSEKLTTDAVLLKRVLGNMLKNGLEATNVGDTVTMGCYHENECARFWVHNPGFIPPDIQSQIFKWSFSTKGKGRGLGTYGMRLLGERYLRGHVSFTSTVEKGTRFEVSIPSS